MITGHCILGSHCPCGGDLPHIRKSCQMWRIPAVVKHSAVIIDLAKARERRSKDAILRQEPTNIALAALDELALALTDHHHQWSEKQVSLYENAVAYLTNRAPSSA